MMRDYKRDYQRRIERGIAAGKTRSQARGHGKGEGHGLTRQRAIDHGFRSAAEERRYFKGLFEQIANLFSHPDYKGQGYKLPDVLNYRTSEGREIRNFIRECTYEIRKNGHLTDLLKAWFHDRFEDDVFYPLMRLIYT